MTTHVHEWISVCCGAPAEEGGGGNDYEETLRKLVLRVNFDSTTCQACRDNTSFECAVCQEEAE